MTYQDEISAIQNISFDSIRNIAKTYIMSLPDRDRIDLYNSLNHGVDLLETDAQMKCYLFSFGKMHQAKINEVLENNQVSRQIAIDFQNTDIQIIDWGCGQGLATACLFDYFKKNDIHIDFVKKVVLIEPSKAALERAFIHVNAYLSKENTIVSINKLLDDVSDNDIVSEQPITIHLFSNILDIPSIDLQLLSNKIKKNLSGKHYFFCWGPLNQGNTRIDSFWSYFIEADAVFANAHGKQQYDGFGQLVNTYNYTAKNRVFKVDKETTDLIFIDYYLPKQFHAAFQLDAVRRALQNEKDTDKLHGLWRNLSEFELQTPFDIGASIYEDVHPILAVLNNIITRGLPTKASPFIEDAFAQFGNRQENDELGGINYCTDDLIYDELFLAMHLADSRWDISADNYNLGVLDSDLEKTFITQTAHPILRQLLCPQRDLSTITNKGWHQSQRVDFSFEFPYTTKDHKGHVIELDGLKYHSSAPQQLSDQQRINELVASGWYSIRLKENEIDKPYEDYHCLGSEYVHYVENAYSKKFDDDWTRILQLVLSPVAVARMEKTILEALMTEKLDINAKKWKVLVKEQDVPCAALAFEDLKQMFEHITQLSSGYSDMRFPDVELTIVSTMEFAKSPLHLGNKVLVGEYKSNTIYDMVIDMAVLRRSGLEKIDFSQYKCKNKCYFNVRSAHYHRNERQIYTSDRIEYKPIVVSNQQGRYDNIEESVENLRYFLHLLFRKADFRPGQTPILSRALQNKSVIGLLPTGGGKSLTYQIAAMLQPGVTLVIDPLRSLMKDQYDGLIKAGIDTCTFINSAIEVPKDITNKEDINRYRIEERERRARRMEQSELLFVFLSPERLSILNFRERLKNMRDTGVYFSYGVIDEVHCVSEWGHDFRFSYLHLGRNLYHYVLPKQKNNDDNNSHITLFGLTATASFDVLADVERELSGNGAFPLDSETIVRDGNTNRFELQYKIEPVPIVFEERDNGTIIIDNWEQVDGKWRKVNAMQMAKHNSLCSLLYTMPSYLNELLEEKSIHVIAKNYHEGPRFDRNIQAYPLHVTIPKDFLAASETYPYGGIVFCPHKKNTGLSVFVNAETIRSEHRDCPIGTFVGSNSDDKDKNEDDFDDEDKISFENLELFRENKIPLMIATKAFGMGIDKPNVRFTINMNYSSSLESFVQEAGRAGRDRKMALSVIMFSKYKIARVKPESKFYKQEKNKWYNAVDIKRLAAKKGIPDADFEICDETSDLVKLKCKQCGDSCKRFESNCCSYSCSKTDCKHRIEPRCSKPCEFLRDCSLSKVETSNRWGHYEHLKSLEEQYRGKVKFAPENYEFLNSDYESVMFFYNNNFKGEMIEKQYMYQLLCKKNMSVVLGENTDDEQSHTISGFLSTLQSVGVGDKIVSYVKYAGEYEDIAKAIYRMCCIELIEDFTQDYKEKLFRIVSQKKTEGEYYNALERYLQRYYSKERAHELIQEVPSYRGDNEIHKCLGYLTHFIYDKIAVKRKRAIDDMHAFCIHGFNEQNDWKTVNEELKDELYFYFNSKYARRGYKTQSDLDYSLTDDTKEGMECSTNVLFKYMDVVDKDWIEQNSESGSTQIDNAKHLYGAVRLIRRQLTDDNAAIYLLAAFCLMFLDINSNNTNKNKVLEEELANMYIDGMKEFYKRLPHDEFWSEVFEKYNQNEYVATYFRDNGGLLKSAAALEIHKEELKDINNKYTA